MAYDLNVVVLKGRIVRSDPELINTSKGTPICKFTVVNNQGEKASFFDCVSFGKTAEFVASKFTNKMPILIEGRLQQETWEKDGEKRSKLSVIVNNVNFAGGDRPSEQANGGSDDPLGD